MAPMKRLSAEMAW